MLKKSRRLLAFLLSAILFVGILLAGVFAEESLVGKTFNEQEASESVLTNLIDQNATAQTYARNDLTTPLTGFSQPTANIIDKSYNTYSYGENYHWNHTYIINLGSVKNANQIDIYWFKKDTHGEPLSYNVEVSQDRVNWKTVATYSDINDNNNTFREVQFQSTNVKYVKIEGTGDESICDTLKRGMFLGEVELYSNPNAVYQENLALDKTGFMIKPDVSGAHDNEFDPKGDLLYPSGGAGGEREVVCANDGLRSTFAVAGGSYQWMYEVDLGEVYDQVNEIKLHFGDGTSDGTPQEFEVMSSLDGISWTTIKKIKYNSANEKPKDVRVMFLPRRARYIRVRDCLVSFYNVTGSRMQMGIGEIEVYAINEKTKLELFPSITNGATNSSAGGKVVFVANKPVADDYVITYQDANGEDVPFNQNYSEGFLEITAKPIQMLELGKRYTVKFSSQKENYTKTVTFTTQASLPTMSITTTSSTLFMQDRENAIYPAFVDNLPYQSWTMLDEYDYFQLKTAGAAGDVVWNLTNGSLPKGLKLSSDGKITGIPTQPGLYNFSVSATDDARRVVSKLLTMESKEYRAKWHNEARLGMMTQWGVYSGSQIVTDVSLKNGTFTIADFEARAVGFNADSWAKTAKEMGAEYFNFTSFGGDEVRLWPSKADCTYRYGNGLTLTTKRNYVQEMIDACDKYGLKFISYIPGGGGWSDLWDTSPKDHTPSTLQKELIVELIEMGVDGFWVDSSAAIGSDYMFDWEAVMPVIRTMNPDVIVGSNPVGTNFGYATNYPYVDYTIYEGHYQADVDGRPVGKWSPTTKKMSVEMTSLHEAQWTDRVENVGSVNSAEDIIANIKRNWSNGVTYTIAIAAPTDGKTLMRPEAHNIISKVAEWAKPNKLLFPFDVNREYTDVADVEGVEHVAFKPAAGKSMVKENVTGEMRNYDSFVGTKFIAGATPITVTKLGRYVVEGNHQKHKLRLVKFEASSMIEREVEIDLATAKIEEDGFAYVEIPPMTLKPGVAYMIMSSENTTDEFARPNIENMESNYYAPVVTTAWTDVSGTRVITPELLADQYNWPVTRELSDVKYGGLTNFKAIIGDDVTTKNLATGSYPTLTDHADNPVSPSAHVAIAQRGVDGDPTTFAVATGVWNWTYHVDLLRTCTDVERIEVRFLAGSQPRQYALYTSTDKVNWTLRKKGGSSQLPNYNDVSVKFSKSKVRYVKFVTLDAAKNAKGEYTGTCISNLEVYASEAVSQLYSTKHTITRADGNFVSKIGLNSTGGELAKGFTGSGEIGVYKENVKVDNGEKIGTGCEVRLIQNDVTKDKLNVVIFGDINGDGLISGVDKILLGRSLAGINGVSLSTAALKAADINKDGQTDGVDSIMLARYLAGWQVTITN